MESLDKLIKGQNRKYLYIFGGVIITAIVLWYLFKDAATTVTKSAEIDVNATDYDPSAEKAKAFASYQAKLLTATTETEKAALKKEYEAEIANIEKTALLQSQYYELFGSYPKSNMTADMIQEAIDIENQSLFDTAASKYKAETNSNPPASCKTASAIYAALDSWKAQKKSADTNKAKMDEFSAKTANYMFIVRELRNQMSKWAYNKYSGDIEVAVARFEELYSNDKPGFVWCTNYYVETMPRQRNNRAGLKAADGLQQLECIGNRQTAITNENTQGRCASMAILMHQVIDNGLDVDDYGNITVKGKVITDYARYFS